MSVKETETANGGEEPADTKKGLSPVKGRDAGRDRQTLGRDAVHTRRFHSGVLEQGAQLSW